jgi:selenide,water dikinase
MEVGRRHGVTAATDVTGFGLAGHLRNILRGSNLSATIDHTALRLLPGVAAHIAAGFVPGGSNANRKFLMPSIVYAGPAEMENAILTAITDAQTSGGLLLCVPDDRAADALAELRALDLPASLVGHLRARGADEPDAAIRVE